MKRARRWAHGEVAKRRKPRRSPTSSVAGGQSPKQFAPEEESAASGVARERDRSSSLDVTAVVGPLNSLRARCCAWSNNWCQDAASWAALFPANRKSAGKQLSHSTRKGKGWIRRSLCQSAWSVTRKKNCYLTACFYRNWGLIIFDQIPSERTRNRLLRRLERLGWGRIDFTAQATSHQRLTVSEEDYFYSSFSKDCKRLLQVGSRIRGRKLKRRHRDKAYAM